MELFQYAFESREILKRAVFKLLSFQFNFRGILELTLNEDADFIYNLYYSWP